MAAEGRPPHQYRARRPSPASAAEHSASHASVAFQGSMVDAASFFWPVRNSRRLGRRRAAAKRYIQTVRGVLAGFPLTV
jgi:hypothetical protein